MSVGEDNPFGVSGEGGEEVFHFVRGMGCLFFWFGWDDFFDLLEEVAEEGCAFLGGFF